MSYQKIDYFLPSHLVLLKVYQKFSLQQPHSNETNENERVALKTIIVQLIIYEKGPYVYSYCVYKDLSVEVAQDVTYDEVEDAIIKQCFPERFVAVIAGKCDASCPLIYPLNERKMIYKAVCVKKGKQ